MGWNDWIYVVPQPNPLTHRADEVEREVNSELAGSLETRLRGRIDHGVELRAAERAQAIRVAAEGNRLVIDEGEDHGVTPAPARSSGQNRTKLDDLFHTSMAVPEVLDDGSVAFRVIGEDDLLGAQERQDETVDHAAQEVLNERLVEIFERAVKKVDLEHPADKTR